MKKINNIYSIFLEFIGLFVFIIVWALILPFAIIATPYIYISEMMKAKNSGWKALIDFYKLPKSLYYIGY